MRQHVMAKDVRSEDMAEDRLIFTISLFGVSSAGCSTNICGPRHCLYGIDEGGPYRVEPVEAVKAGDAGIEDERIDLLEARGGVQSGSKSSNREEIREIQLFWVESDARLVEAMSNSCRRDVGLETSLGLFALL